jgi:hypothetical protein
VIEYSPVSKAQSEPANVTSPGESANSALKAARSPPDQARMAAVPAFGGA